MVDLDLAGTVAGAVSGDQESWDQLVERYSGMVWGIARAQGLDKTDAADVSQTVWLRLAEHIGRLRDPERIGGWLAVTTRNEAQRVRRRRQYQVPTSHERFERLPDRLPVAPESAIEAAEESARLWKAFEALGEGCRVLLRMLMSDPPPSYELVSRSLGIPIGSIGPRRSRCLGHLRSEVEAAEEGPVAEDRSGS